MRRKMKSMSLYQKFAATIIFLGLVPMMVLTTFVGNNMIKEYRNALSSQYEQAAGYVSSSLMSMLDGYNTISKMPYYYNYSADGNTEYNYLSFDNFRKIVYGDEYDSDVMQEERRLDMENFLNYLGSTDANIISTHFIARDLDGNKLDFHSSMIGTYLKNEELFEERIQYEEMDDSSNKMILIPTHETGYFNGLAAPVFTIARNYFDLRGEVGNTPYVGTLFIDVNLNKVEKIFRSVNFSGEECIYVVNEAGDCFYSNVKEKISCNMATELQNLNNTENQLVITSNANDYGLSVIVVMNTKEAFSSIRRIQRFMYVMLGISILALFAGSIFFSRRLTRPIHEMMEQMSEIENGNFEIEIPVRTNDEIGTLAQRFNQMCNTLNEYINQSYVAKIRQDEAELTALKSQIYPHFLYNTLEIIRMTALEDGESKVPKMIEALSEQIHYLIGPMQDMVPLEKEIDIVRKYVYLLNCRIAGKVQLTVNAHALSGILVPKLILQPIVENAYVHGIKPKKGKGTILIKADVKEEQLQISVMDNGSGMNEKALLQIKELMLGSEPGIKNEYNWQSIGLKNVHDRIKFLYGNKYGIEITSTEGIGTMVRIVMPVQREG